MIPVVVLGAGGHGRDIAHSARVAGWKVLGFLDDKVDGPEVLGSFGMLPSLGAYAMIGLNSSRLRAMVDTGAPAPVVWDRSAAWAVDVRTQPGVWIGPQVAVGPGVVLGRHTHIGAGSTITRAVLGDYVTAAPGVTICGDVMVGDRVQIGAGAVVTNMRMIGDDAVIGAGAVVLEDVPAGSTYVCKGVKGVAL